MTLAQRFHYKLSTDKALYLLQPSQYWEETFDDYVLRVFFYYDHAAWLQNHENNLNDSLIQDVFIKNMYDSKGLFAHVQQERASGTEAQQQQYVGNRFISSIQGMVASSKHSANKFGSSLTNQSSPCPRPRRNNFSTTRSNNVCPTSSLNYDAYYDNGYNCEGISSRTSDSGPTVNHLDQ